MTGTAGPVMSAADANAFMYAIHYKVEAMEKWAVTVNESITDHAEHIDTTRARASHSFQTVSDEINRIRTLIAPGASDTKRFMEFEEQNDTTLKASVAGVVELRGSSIAATRTDIDQKVRDTQAAVQALHDSVAATASSTAAGEPAAPP